MSSVPSLAEARTHLSELVARVSAHHERVLVTVHGKPSAVLLAPDDLAALEEKIAVPSDPAALQRRAASDREIAEGPRGVGSRPVGGDAAPAPPGQVTPGAPHALSITPPARRQPTEHLPAAVALAAHEFVVGPLLDDPHRIGKRLHAPPAGPSRRPTGYLPRGLPHRRRATRRHRRRRIASARRVPLSWWRYGARQVDAAGRRGGQ